MKKLFYFTSLVCFSFMTSCTSDVDTFLPEASGNKITIGVNMPEHVETRISTNDLKDLKWESGDRIILLGYDSNNNFLGRTESDPIKNGTGTKNAVFDIITIAGASKYKMFYNGDNVTINNDGSLSADYNNQFQDGNNNSERMKSNVAAGSDEINAADIRKGIILNPLNSILKVNIKSVPANHTFFENANEVNSIEWLLNDKQTAFLYIMENGKYGKTKIIEGQNNIFYMAFDSSVTLPKNGIFKIKIGSREAEITLPEGRSFEKGIIYNVTLDYDEKGTWGFIGKPGGNVGNDTDTNPQLPDPSQIEWANKTFWVSGVNVPPLEMWGNYAHRKGLEWKSGQGWYDCTKYLDNKHDDENLCWAATCSNMIYWWLDQNKENIVKFGYKGPKKYVSALDCEIFQYFNDHFDNYGCMIENGLDWFFNGKHIYGGGGNATSSEEPVNGWPAHKGFFKEVLGNSKFYRISTGADFNENLKIAFLNNESIGLDISVSAGKGAHAVTIWGAKFDENGNVCELYEVENNDPGALEGNFSPTTPGKESNIGLFSHKVKLQNGTYTLESSSPGSYTIPIRAAYFLGNHKELWNAYWEKSNKQ